MRILIVTYFYAPAPSPRAYRWAAIAEHWVGRGHDVDVLCARLPRAAAVETVRGVRVFRVASALDLWRMRLREGTAGQRGGERGAPVGRRVRAWLARGAYGQAWRRFYWPDHACLWYLPAAKQGRDLLRRHDYDALISVSIPFTSHLIARRLCRLQPRLRWIVDIGDPFSLPGGIPQNNRRLYARLNRWAEGQIVRMADAVVLVAAPAVDRYVELFPEIAGKLHVIPPVVSPDAEPCVPGLFPRDGKIRLVFAGTLYRALRDPTFLLTLFERLLQTQLGDRLELHFFGDVNDCWDAFAPFRALLGTRVFLHGVVARAVALRALREADVLINIGNRTPYQLPSKVVEYTSTGKPILNLVSTDADACADFLKTYPAALSIPEGEVGLARLRDLVRFVAHPPAVAEPDLRRWRAEFSVEEIAGAYERHLAAGPNLRLAGGHAHRH